MSQAFRSELGESIWYRHRYSPGIINPQFARVIMRRLQRFDFSQSTRPSTLQRRFDADTSSFVPLVSMPLLQLTSRARQSPIAPLVGHYAVRSNQATTTSPTMVQRQSKLHPVAGSTPIVPMPIAEKASPLTKPAMGTHVIATFSQSAGELPPPHHRRSHEDSGHRKKSLVQPQLVDLADIKTVADDPTKSTMHPMVQSKFESASTSVLTSRAQSDSKANRMRLPLVQLKQASSQSHRQPTIFSAHSADFTQRIYDTFSIAKTSTRNDETQSTGQLRRSHSPVYPVQHSTIQPHLYRAVRNRVPTPFVATQLEMVSPMRLPLTQPGSLPQNYNQPVDRSQSDTGSASRQLAPLSFPVFRPNLSRVATDTTSSQNGPAGAFEQNVQRQAEMDMAASSNNVTSDLASAGVEPNANVSEIEDNEPDLDEFVERALRQLVRQLATEQERRGGVLWR